MKLKSTILFACTAVGLSVLLGIYTFVKGRIIERAEYMTFESDLYNLIPILSVISIFVFLVVLYNKQKYIA